MQKPENETTSAGTEVVSYFGAGRHHAIRGNSMVSTPGAHSQRGVCVMDEFAKQLWSSVVIVMTAVGFICLIVMEVPKLIETMLFGAPKGVTHPNARWGALTLLLAAVALHYIWSQPGPAEP